MPERNQNDFNLESHDSTSTEHIRQFIKRYRSIKNPLLRSMITLLLFLRNAYKTLILMCVDSEYRSAHLLELLHSKNAHQTTSLTSMNRYPEIFSACKDYFNDRQNISILSFGCSTGEEVITLRHYFPKARIVGAELNKRSLSICRSLPVDCKVSFIYSTQDELKKNGPYDAIFCMAVLQRKPHIIANKKIDNLKRIYPFEKFEKQLNELDQLLLPEGLFVIHYTQYSFDDTIISPKYKALGDYNQNSYGLPVFDKNSNLIKIPTPQNSIYIKKNLK